jgi:CRISPR-associated exonuclease Cas4
MITDEITIRSIQHYIYCSHRWGLLEIDKAWAENVFVTKANLLHERVHNPDKNYTSKGKKVFTAVPIYNDRTEYNLYGIADCLELSPDKNGVRILENGEVYKLCIVEYKPTKPKNAEFREDDLMQVFAQKLCVDYVFGGDCEGIIYYADVKKRVTLPLRENFQKYDDRLKELLAEMREYLRIGKIPPIQKGQNCSGCSMKDMCMPGIKSLKNLRGEIEKIGRAEV